ncbi:MAG: DNA recombination protein RmuC [Chitinispirillia bacterium]|nr:DNA recombination protein RmuC [Chitinispirillia bacterium]MCL2269179.1 DNA recombination protein RmuC [Chitinispirillia bacterium]
MDIFAIIAVVVCTAAIIAAVVLTGRKNGAGRSVPPDYNDVLRKLAVTESEIAARTAETSRLAAKIEELTGENKALAIEQSRLNTLCESAKESERAARSDKDKADGQAAEKQAKINDLEKAAAVLQAKLDASNHKLESQKSEIEAIQEHIKTVFKNIAAEILDEKSKTFSEGLQKELNPIVNPLKKDIEEFKKRVEDAQKDSKEDATKLTTMIKLLNDQSRDMSEKAENLTLTLRGSTKVQGDWGEFILLDLLEKAGLREGEQFSFQQNFAVAEIDTGESRRNVRTDVIVNLPSDNRSLVIDSKVSLNAYYDYVNAASEEERGKALDRHISNIRRRVKELAEAGYHRLPEMKTPDFVVMFVPIEPALLTALHHDRDLWSYAYEKKILFVSPTTLLYIVRIVDMLWKQKEQVLNVQDVMDRGLKLYEKFVGFLNDMDKINESLSNARKHYDNARSKLNDGPGSLTRQVDMLRKLGVDVKREKRIQPKWLGPEEAEETEFTTVTEDAGEVRDEYSEDAQ